MSRAGARRHLFLVLAGIGITVTTGTVIMISEYGESLDTTQPKTFATKIKYTPDWIKGKDQHQILLICSTIVPQPYEYDLDLTWCSEYTGYVLDSIMPVQGFDLPTERMPDWASAKGLHHLLSICTNSDEFPNGQFDYWCYLYQLHLLDSMEPPIVFADRTGYIPEWTVEMGSHQILLTCRQGDTPEISKELDKNWCDDYTEHVLFQSDPPDQTFVTRDGYSPDWAEGKGPNQITSECKYSIDSKENFWCLQYTMHRIEERCLTVVGAQFNWGTGYTVGEIPVCHSHYNILELQ